MQSEYQLVNEKEAAKILCISPVTLRTRRSTGDVQGLPHVKIGRSIRYRLTDIYRFIDANSKGKEAGV